MVLAVSMLAIATVPGAFFLARVTGEPATNRLHVRSHYYLVVQANNGVQVYQEDSLGVNNVFDYCDSLMIRYSLDAYAMQVVSNTVYRGFPLFDEQTLQHYAVFYPYEPESKNNIWSAVAGQLRRDGFSTDEIQASFRNEIRHVYRGRRGINAMLLALAALGCMAIIAQALVNRRLNHS